MYDWNVVDFDIKQPTNPKQNTQDLSMVMTKSQKYMYNGNNIYSIKSC